MRSGSTSCVACGAVREGCVRVCVYVCVICLCVCVCAREGELQECGALCVMLMRL